MPTFNRRDLILESVNSVLSQDYDDFELIIKDGGEPIFDILPKDPRIKYIWGKDRGITDAMNQAMKIAEGDVFNWCNDDDLMKEGTLKYISENLGDSKWCFGKIEQSNGEVSGRAWNLNEMLRRNIVPQPSVFWTREAMNEVGLMSEDEDLVSDYEYWLRLGSKFEPLFLDRVMALYRIHPNQITATIPQEQLAQAGRVAKRYEQ